MSKEEKIKNRIGYFGSSDAKMIAKIGKNGCLNDADRQRIAIYLGLEEQRQFYSGATQLGNTIEEMIFEAIKSKYGDNVTSNPYYKSEKLSKKYGIEIGTHIDYEINYSNGILWIENKATIDGIVKTIDKYKYQLAWHNLLLDEKDSKGTLQLSHYDTNEFEEKGFTAENLSLTVIPKHYFSSEKSFILKGLEIISTEIKNGFHYDKREELYAENLPEKIQNRLIEIKGFFNQIAEAERQIDLFKETMLNIMIEENVKSIKNEFFSLTVVPEGITTSFDKKTFEKENPALVAKYQKQSKRRAYLTIKNY